ncbi:sensor histidine kinase [uncultured Corynebacterium sp.]|uniref:sensor histidine kinase n=1 Tax=uncultured Corynebacterium sp. TaxID=159447 RepID=UPI0025CC4F96|nr:histidine kinase [uncultured Corynebacterium sp.]
MSVRRYGAPGLVVLFAGVLFTVAWPTYHLTHSLHPAIVPLIAAAGTWPVITAVRRPLASWLVVAASCLVSLPFHENPDYALGWPVAFHLALAFTLAVVVLRGPARDVTVAVAATVLLMALNPAEVVVGWIVGTLVWSAFLLLVRWLLASRRQVRTESTRATEQSQLRVMAEERNRLVRDLHDVVAHQMSMIVVQAQSAPYRLQGVTPSVHAEFDSIADTAREALNQVRELLGVLRSDAESGATTPVGADQIEPVLTAARRAGMDLTWTLDGGVASLDDTVGVVLQRVLQESLSNASRHAPGGKVLVNLTVTEKDGRRDAELTVDNGPAAPGEIVPPEHSGGSGIPGMAARVRAVGGSFTALPAADGGFTVRAVVPVTR